MRAIAIATFALLSACGQSSAPAPNSPPPSGPQEPRAQIIIDRLPLIDACLALSPETPTVTINPTANLSVRLSGASGTFDCVVPNDAPNPESATILPALDEPPADAILFVRAPGGDPGGECYEAPEVRNADGELLGWTLDPDGC